MSIYKYEYSEIMPKHKISPSTRFFPHKTVSYEEIFPGNFGVGGVKNFLGKKTSLTRKFSGKISSEILAWILLAEEILKPKISWRQQEILRRNFGIT